MAVYVPQPWSVHDVPSLNSDGSNAEVWCLIVRAVASQHGASELLHREPHPGDKTEAAIAEHMKNFLIATACDNLKAALDKLTAMQAWRFLKVAFNLPEEANRIESPTTPVSPLLLPKGVRSAPVLSTSVYPVPDGYPVRDNIIIFTDDEPNFVTRIKSINSLDSGLALDPSEERKDKNIQGPNSLTGNEKKPASEPPPKSKTNDDVALGGEGNDDKKEETEEAEKEGKVAPSGEDNDGKKEESEKPKEEGKVVPISKFRPFSRRHKALIIGINYSYTLNQLDACVRDAAYIAHLLMTRFFYRPDEIYMLTDDPHPLSGIRTGKPTRYGIDDGMNWLMRDARPGDSLFFSYSGHGTRVKDIDGDEGEDGYDEAICPVDGYEAGNILDDELFHKLVRRVPVGARLTAITDSCHSGSVLDLPHMYDPMTGEEVQTPTNGEKDDEEENKEEEEEEEEEKPSRMQRLMSKLREKRNKLHLRRREESTQDPEELSVDSVSDYGEEKYPTDRVSKGGEVVHISGCRDNQYSTEQDISTKGSGLMTFCLVEAIERGEFRNWHEYTYGSLLRTIATKVQAWDHAQWPLFSSAHPFNLDTPFSL